MFEAQKKRFVNATELESQFQKKVQSYRGTLAAIAYQSALETIKEAPTADVAPVRHGEWVFKSRYYEADECNCSECGQLMTTHIGERMNYCPQCGCRMDGGAENDL